MKWVEENIILLGNQNGGYADRESLRMDNPLLTDLSGTLLTFMHILSSRIEGIVDRGYVGESVPHFAGVRLRAKMNQFFQTSQ